MPADERLAIRQEHSLPLLVDFEEWMRIEPARLSRHADVAKAMNYMLTRWDVFACFTTDGHICLSNNAAERALSGIALGRRLWKFAGLAAWRQALRLYADDDRHRQAQRGRSVSLVRPGSCPHCQHAKPVA